METERLKFIDISKGIGMVMIVWMHVWGNRPAAFAQPNEFFQILNELISGIYVPLFFVLSGMLIKFDNFNFRAELVKKIKSLLRPFIVMYILSFLVSFPLHLLGFSAKHDFALSNILNVVYSETFFNGPLWFLLSLFWSFMLFYGIALICKRNEVVTICVLLVMGCIGFYINRFGITLPLFIGPAIVASPLLMIGFLIRKYIFNKQVTGVRNQVILAISGLLVFLLFRSSFSMQSNVYSGSYIKFILSVLGGSIMIVCTSMLCERWLNIVAYWGRYSIIILCLHNFILIPVSKVLGIFVHSQILWSVSTLIIVYLSFFIIIPLIKITCPTLFNIKK